MRGLVRLLLMFGPMIIRAVQKQQRRKERQQRRRKPLPSNRKRHQPDDKINKIKKKHREVQLTEEERNFKMKEEEFMLDESLLEEYSSETFEFEKDSSEKITQDQHSKIEMPDNDDLDLKEIFFDDLEAKD